MKPNTLIQIPDGRIGRVVYHSIDGYGVRWGTEPADENDLPEPDAMLRKPYVIAAYECVGEEWEIIAEPKQLRQLKRQYDGKGGWILSDAQCLQVQSTTRVLSGEHVDLLTIHAVMLAMADLGFCELESKEQDQ